MNSQNKISNYRAQTYLNICEVARENFEGREVLKFAIFMLQRFGDSYQTKEYCQEWADRIKNKATHKMDVETFAEYKEIYG